MKSAATKGNMVSYTLKGSKRIGFVKQLPSGWYFLSAMPASVISAPVRKVINTTILVGLGVLLLTSDFGLLCCAECVPEASDGASRCH